MVKVTRSKFMVPSERPCHKEPQEKDAKDGMAALQSGNKI